ncbi:hypothetical protein AMATHDRAFT_45011 [Amanita thiersii Skay4041]|uniref:RGS domain-containing protein n=1 Tax=Amanita thiersii Skay4041 TaxID=703135 RepID=A0A2A9NSK3_9AGAR|nr:hypothetical protein AMATHDRAFT_45011 [Amanita thiersii Skay4041]
MSAENLYFILWLKEYTIRYKQWLVQVKAEREAAAKHGVPWSLHTSINLASFYARAKQTFFTPNAPYELNLPSNILAPFHAPLGPNQHPDPAFFNDVAIETRCMLEASLRRFVNAQLNNVGNNRVLCGIIVGSLIIIVGIVPPLAVNLALGQSRWTRLAAIPALWIGLTVVLCAFHGICVGVYVFGDLRQLRKFELARPPGIKLEKERPSTTVQPTIVPIQQVVACPPPCSPAPVYRTPLRSMNRLPSIASVSSTSSSNFPPPPVVIEISPPMSDYDSIEGPATNPGAVRFSMSSITDEPKHVMTDSASESSTFCTASFIHPFDANKDADYIDLDTPPEEFQRIAPFDFEALPPPTRNKNRRVPTFVPVTRNFQPTSPLTPKSSSKTPTTSQEKCNSKRRRSAASAITPSGAPRPVKVSVRTSYAMAHSTFTVKFDEKQEEEIRQRFRLVKAVPAFAVPLTRVLSPEIKRGQWEIVTRSMGLAFLLSWLVIGPLLAIPRLK